MNATGIDHVSLHIPADGVDEFVALYGDALGFKLEHLEAYRHGEQQFFCVRLTEKSVIQIHPSTNGPNRDEDSLDHVAIRTDESMSELLDRLEASRATIKTVITQRYGATGPSSSVYFEDPFGYTVELKPTPTDS